MALQFAICAMLSYTIVIKPHELFVLVTYAHKLRASLHAEVTINSRVLIFSLSANIMPFYKSVFYYLLQNLVYVSSNLSIT